MTCHLDFTGLLLACGSTSLSLDVFLCAEVEPSTLTNDSGPACRCQAQPPFGHERSQLPSISPAQEYPDRVWINR